jgi:hypothetical protein
MAKHRKMTAEDRARYRRNRDRLRELLIRNGAQPPRPRRQPKP